MPIKKKSGESKDEFISRCISYEINNGMEQDQAIAVCYNIVDEEFSNAKLSDINKIRKGEKLLGVSWKSLGLTNDMVNNSEYYKVMEDYEEFASVPSRIGETEDNLTEKTYYRYIGPEPQRDFCKDLMSVSDGRFLTMEDIVSLNDKNPRFAKKGQTSYSVFNWRGGKFCTHRWVKYTYDIEKKTLKKSLIQPRQEPVGGVTE